MNLLQVDHVGKHYDTAAGPLTVLDDVNLALSPGQAAAIMGPSGTGKSTLLYILGALEEPSTGSVSLGGRNIFQIERSRLADFRNAEIGFVFQDHCLLPQCSVLENVLIPTLVAPGNDFDRRAHSLIEQIGLKQRLNHRPSQLSGGEKQRVAIARALIREPRLVLCDEPTGNLDETSAASVANLLFDLHRRSNNILIVVTHSPRLASHFPIRYDLSGGKLERVS